jgi:Outer membrane protein beta-barrel family/Carboxypeptidase regulatory-like domain
MKKIIGIFCMLFVFNYLSAQSINGIVKDSTVAVESASVYLLLQSDSSLVAFTLTDEKGYFNLNGIINGLYLIQIAQLGYESHWQTIEMKSATYDMGIVNLMSSSQVIPTITVVESMLPMNISKDTVQYNAKAYGVKPGDIAEDLLKKLPGIEVQRDGSVKAFGEKVENVLVDGKEFFGKDTKIATKNLDADAIDKVQVFDRKSDMAEFTGIEDGQDERTINLKLKDDKKVGYFGTMEAGGGTDQRFKTRANINRFTPALRTSFIGMGNNINEQNFSISDYIDFMGGISSFMSGGGGRVSIDLGSENGLPLGMNQNKGVQKSWASGLNVSKMFSPKTDLTASIFHNDFHNDLVSNTSRTSLLNTNFFNSYIDEKQFSKSSSTSFNVRCKSKIDSFQNIIFKLNGGFSDNRLNTIMNSDTRDDLQRSINNNHRDFNAMGNGYNMDGSLTWLRKFRKKGRSLALSANTKVSKSENEGLLKSTVDLFFPQSEILVTDQLQQSENKGMDYRFTGRITEPVGNKIYLEFNSEWANYHNNAHADYFDFISDEYIKNQLLSTLYQRDFYVLSNGLKYSVNRKKYNLALGLNYQNSILKGITQPGNNDIKINYPAILPSGFMEYQFGMSHRMQMDYVTQIQEPSLVQLQPTVNNSDPLNVYIGNSKLRPEYVHDLGINYLNYNAFNFTMLYASLSVNHTQNRITNQVSIDSSYKRTITPVNVKYENSLRANVEYNMPLKPIKSTFKIKLSSDVSNSILFINDISNNVNRLGTGFNVSLENKNKKYVDALIGYKYYNKATSYSVSAQLDQWFSQKTIFAELKWSLSDMWTLQSNLDVQQYNQSFDNIYYNIPLWTAGITRFFGEQKKLRISLNVFDILNKNNGINRTSTLNYNEVSQSNALGQYFMLSMSYNIKGFKKKSDDVIEIKTGG